MLKKYLVPSEGYNSYKGYLQGTTGGRHTW